MKLRVTILIAFFVSFVAVNPSWGQEPAEEEQSDIKPVSTEKRFSLNVKSGKLPDLLALIAKQNGLDLELEDDIAGEASYRFSDVTLKEALRSIAQDHNLAFSIQDGALFVSKQEALTGTQPTERRNGGSQGVRKIPIRYGVAKEIVEKLPKIMKSNESIVAEEASNSLVFFGSAGTFEKLRSFAEALDEYPRQVLIEAQIVETSDNFSRELGFQWGDLSAQPAVSKNGRIGGNLTTAVPTSPNLNLRYLLGWVDGRTLETRILAAESTGDAKILSRPKIITLNNQDAVIHSGVTFNVKTLSSTITADPGTGGASTVTGGLQEITAGLELKVLPTIVGDNLIRLKVNVSNSEPNDSLSVDGIPGIVDNSSNASIVIPDGQTLTMAGLIKQTMGKSETLVPLLGRIPLIGWLFRSTATKDRKTELMIFITPRIIRPGSETAAAGTDATRTLSK